MRYRLTGLLIACGLLLALPASAAGPITDISHNGQLLDTSQPVLNVNDRTMIAFRDYFEAVDAQVDWDNDRRTAVTSYDGVDLFIDPDHSVVLSNGRSVDLDVPPQIINDRIYLPLRFFGEAMGYQVDFHVVGQNHYRVDILKSELPEAPAVSLPDPVKIIPRPEFYPASAGYYIQDDVLIEIAGVRGAIQHRSIRPDGSVSTLNFKRAGEQVIRDVSIENGEPVILRNLPASLDWPYVGPAMPSFTKPFSSFHSSLGPVEVYGTDIRESAYIFRNNKLAYDNLSRSGLVLKFAEPFDASRTRWTEAGSSQAALVDGSMLIFNKDRLLLDKAIDATDFIPDDDRIYAIGSQNDRFYLAAFDQEGRELRPYSELAQFDSYGPLYLRDNIVSDGRLWLLLANDRQTKLVSVDQANPSRVQLRELGQGLTFTSFAQDIDGKLFAIAPTSNQFIIAPLR